MRIRSLLVLSLPALGLAACNQANDGADTAGYGQSNQQGRNGRGPIVSCRALSQYDLQSRGFGSSTHIALQPQTIEYSVGTSLQDLADQIGRSSSKQLVLQVVDQSLVRGGSDKVYLGLPKPRVSGGRFQEMEVETSTRNKYKVAFDRVQQIAGTGNYYVTSIAVKANVPGKSATAWWECSPPTDVDDRNNRFGQISQANQNQQWNQQGQQNQQWNNCPWVRINVSATLGALAKSQVGQGSYVQFELFKDGSDFALDKKIVSFRGEGNAQDFFSVTEGVTYRVRASYVNVSGTARGEATVPARGDNGCARAPSGTVPITMYMSR